MTDQEITVNFSRALPVFPVPDMVLLPHAVQPLNIFEPRVRQMIDDSLDQSGQIALASYSTHPSGTEADLNPVVCIGQIIDHQLTEGGQQIILLYGVCRAKITRLMEPGEGDAYITAQLEPLEKVDEEPPPMPRERRQLHALLSGPRLSRLRDIEAVMDWFADDDVSTHALLELIGVKLIHDSRLRYRLLAEPSAPQRASIITAALLDLDRLIRQVDCQSHATWPKGVSWN